MVDGVDSQPNFLGSIDFFCVIQLVNMYISQFTQHRVAEIRGWLNTCVTETGLLLVCFVVILT